MAKKFDFLSPGIEIREIDQSFLPQEAEAEGPIIIGRTRKGPANKPVKIRNLDDYVSVFGLPVAGGAGVRGDMWRDGNMIGPTYASYAAQAWLASENSPVTMVRLVGEQSANPSVSSGLAKAGWDLSGSLSSTEQDNSTAYGLFLCASGATDFGTGSLAAVFYANKGYIGLKGTDHAGNANQKKAGTFIKSVGTNCEFKLKIYDEDQNETTAGDIVINFNRNDGKYIRSVLNTNPQLVNEDTVTESQRKTYWLGESFVREIEDSGLLAKGAGEVYGILLPLDNGTLNWGDHREAAAESMTGWVISQKETDQTDLFRLKSLHTGEDIQKDYMIAIENITQPANQNVNPYGTFTVAIKDLVGNTVERYTGLNFNPSSENYIARRIGDQYQLWSDVDRRYRTYGEFQNQSNIVYVEVKQFIKDGGGQGFLPAGFKGPVRPKGFTLAYGSQGAQTLGDSENSGTAAEMVLTFGNGSDLTGLPSNGTLEIDFGLEGTYTITFDNTAGSTDASVGSDKAVTIDPSVETDSPGVAQRVLLLLRDGVTGDKLKNAYDFVYDDSVTGAETVTITSKLNGPAHNMSATESLTNLSASDTDGTDSDDFAGAFVKGNASMPLAGGDANNFVDGPANFTASFNFPSLPLRTNGTEGGAPDPYRAYWGIRPKLSSTSTAHDADYIDYLRRLPAGVDSHTPGNDYEHSFVFSLDDIVIDTNLNTVTYTEDSYDDSTSYSALNSFGDLLDKNVKQFVMPLHGGFDGLDIKEKEPFRDGLMSVGTDDSESYLKYSINKAIDSIADSEVVPANLLLAPGFRNTSVTNKIIQTAERRKDVLAIIDLQDDYLPPAERLKGRTDEDDLGSVAGAISSLKRRSLDSSYAATFFPWVQVSDNLNNSQLLWIPPSVAALGAFGRSQAQSELWFAPAGFNRGGLGALGGARGPKVLQARQRLDSKERDALYEVNINPIATFPAEGVVIFGQKTLQARESALNRINVRRLVLYLKSEVSKISRNLLFDQNVQSTWNRFKGQVNPVMSSVAARFGLTDYQVVLDETTTTADLIDRNVMYAKIYIKPARAIEYIVVDFVITKTGADFV
jgi:hypothetical protein